jgi:hypothetical protein
MRIVSVAIQTSIDEDRIVTLTPPEADYDAVVDALADACYGQHGDEYWGAAWHGNEYAGAAWRVRVES